MEKKIKSEKKLSDFFRYKGLPKYEGLLGKIPVRAGTTYVGVEVELERVITKNKVHPTSFIITEDGSLRNNGKEFITIPINFCFLEKELERMFSNLSRKEITSRCSVHVHLNVRDFTQKELFTFVLLYFIFEKSLYKLSGKRWDNLFCIPLYNFPNLVGATLSSLHNEEGDGVTRLHWNKYSGLNLCPIWDRRNGKGAIGTVEFRQLEGTTDVERIINWINLIVSLKISSKMLSKEGLIKKIEEMNTSSDYYNLCDFVFREWSPQIRGQETFKEDVESCITRAKFLLWEVGLIKSEEKVTKIFIK